MRILFFTNEYSHKDLPPAGGVGTFFKIMTSELTKRGHTVFIYGFSKKSFKIIDDEATIVFFKKYFKQYPLAELSRSVSSKLGFKRTSKYFVEKERKYLAKKLHKYATEQNIDVIQSFTFSGYTAFWQNTIPLVTRYHGSRGFWEQYLGDTDNHLKIKMEKKALEATPYTIANSYFSADFIKGYYNVSVDTVIQNGINTQLFTPNYSVDTIEKSIFYFGTLSKAKGVDRLAQIFNVIVEKHPTATLHLIGKNETYFNFLKDDILSKKAIKNTTYYGPLVLEKIPEKLSQASVIAVPSRGETFGFTIVEAMAMEKPTIVFNIPVAEEIITHKDDGLIAHNKEEFIKHIDQVFKNPENYKTLKLNARKKVLANFTQELLVEKSIKYYESILSVKK